MASPLGGEIVALASGGDRVKSGESCQGKDTVELGGAQRGDEMRGSPKLQELDDVESQEQDLLQALSNTDARATDEPSGRLIADNAFAPVSGFDEPSLMLVTKKLMDNILRKKPSFTAYRGDAKQRVAAELRGSKFVARDRNNVNLMASRWDQNKLVVYPVIAGLTLDTLLPLQFPRAVKIKSLRDSMYKLLSADNIQEEIVDNLDLQALPEEKALEVLASGFIKTGDDYVDEIVRRSLATEPQAGGNKLKETLLSLRTHAAMVQYVRELGLVKDGDYKAVMQNMLVADLVSLLIDEAKKVLETAIVSYAIACDMINKRDPTNCRIFRFSCVGSALIKAKVGSIKNFKLVIDDDDCLSQLVVSLRCIENKGRVSILKLEIAGDVMLPQRSVVKLYSGLYRSTGVIDASTDEVITIQDDVFEGFLTAELLDFVDANDDYTVTNASGLVPMMVLGGIVPNNLEDPATNICWQISLKSVVNNLCRLNRVFDSSVARNHFLFNFKTALVIASGMDSAIEIKKFIVQFFLWARFVDKASTVVHTDYHVNSLVNNKGNKAGSGLGAQCLWIASALLDMSVICETGYKYLPIIIFFNMLCSGGYSAKLVNMGVWLANSLNLNTNRLAEDRGLLDVMEKIGAAVNIDWKRRLAMQPDIGSKIAVSVEMLREQMHEVAQVVTGTNCTKTEAALLCKFALMSVDETASSSDGNSVDYVTELSILVAEKMKDSAERGEMSSEDYLMLINEMARDMEDDDEVKQVLNTEGTKYHTISDMLFEKKKKAADATGRWRQADVGEAPSSLRRKEMERQLVKDFTNQTVAFSERARNTMYQLTDFNSETMRDTLGLNGAIITSFLHRMGRLGGKDINILLSTLAGKGVEGTSALLSADDVNLLSVSSLETSDSVRGESASSSSTTKLTLLEGISLTVGISRTFDLAKFLEAVDRLTKKKSVSSAKLRRDLEIKEALRLQESASADEAGGESSLVVSATDDNSKVIKSYFSSLMREFEECFEVMAFENDDPAFTNLRKIMLTSANFPMGVLNCITVIIRRLSDLIWDLTTYLYDEMDASSKEEASSMDGEALSRTRRAANMSMETLKVALSTALISYKVTFTTYFSVAEGSVSLMKRLSVKLARKMYQLLEKELIFCSFFFGLSADIGRVKKYVHGRQGVLCDHVGKDIKSMTLVDGALIKTTPLTKVELAVCVVTKPIRIVNRFLATIVNKMHSSYLFTSTKFFNLFVFCKKKTEDVYSCTFTIIKKKISTMTSSFKAASDAIKRLSSRFFEKNNEADDKGKGVMIEEPEDVDKAPTVSPCGLQTADVRRCGKSEKGEARADGAQDEAEYIRGAAGSQARLDPEQEATVRSQDGASGSAQSAAVDSSRIERMRRDSDQAVLRVIVATENRFTRFARVMATRASLVTRILMEEWVDTVEDILYLIFSRVGYTDKYNVISLSMELDAGTIGDYQQRVLAAENKRTFYFKTYKTAYRFCQNAHEKFVTTCEKIAQGVSAISIFYKEYIVKGVMSLVSGIEELRKYIARCVGSFRNASHVVVLSDNSTDDGCSSKCGSMEQYSSSLSSINNLVYNRKRNDNALSRNMENQDESSNTGANLDESVSYWLMFQDEKDYEPCDDNMDYEPSREESREAYFSYLRSEQPNEIQLLNTKDEIGCATGKELTLLSAREVAKTDESDDVKVPSSDDEAAVGVNLIDRIIKDLKNKISEVVWMHEAGNFFRREHGSMRGVNWVLSSLGSNGLKHMLKYVGEASFDKMVVITGEVNEAILRGVEIRLDALVCLGINRWTDERIIRSMIKDLEANFEVSLELVSEGDVNDKLAEIIAIEFEREMCKAIRQRRSESRDRRLEEASEAKVKEETSMSNEVVRKLREKELAKRGTLKTPIDSRTETRAGIDATLMGSGYVRYDESPVLRVLSKIASYTGLSPKKKKNDGVGGSLTLSKRLDTAADAPMKGLTLALMQAEDDEEKNAGRNFCEEDDVNDEKREESVETSLKVRKTGSERTESIANVMLRLLTKSLKDNAIGYVRSWTDADSKRKDKIAVEVIERQGHLSRDDEREIRLRGYASLAPMWDSLADVFSFTVECDNDKEENNAVEIFGRRRLVKHGKNHDSVKYLIKKEIDIIDTGDVSILCLPANVESMRENLISRGKYKKKNNDDYSCSLKAVCDVTAGKSSNKVIKGKSCVIRNDSLGIEMLMLPSHLNAYGRNLPDSESVDALDCLAIVAADSTWQKTPKQVLLDAETGVGTTNVSGILARQEFDTSSRYFSIVTVDAVDWRGKSGAPIVDGKGKFLGIILMQITDGSSFNVLNEAGVIICAKPSLSARPIFHSTSVRVAKCFCCEANGERRPSKSYRYKSSESGSDISKSRYTLRKKAARNVDSAEKCDKCDEINREVGSVGQTKERRLENDEEKREIKKTCEDCLIKQSKSADVNALERGKNLLKAGLNYLIGRGDGETRGHEDASLMGARKTGALDRIGEILAESRVNKIDAGASDDVVIHNISEILYYSSRQCADDLTKVILEFILEQLVKGRKPVVICSTNTSYLIVMLLMSALRLRFDRVRSVSELQKACCTFYKKTRTNVVIVSNEDISCSALSMEKLSLSCQHHKVSCLVLTSDNEAVKNCSLVSLKILSLFLTNMLVIMYDCKRQTNSVEESATSSAEKLTCIETKRMDTYQNCGVIHHLQLSNVIIEMARLNGLSSDNEDGDVRHVVITMCNNAKDYGIIKNRISKAMEVHIDSILVTNHGAFASKQLWEVIKTCKNVYLHTGAKATYVNDIVVNCSLDTDMAVSEKGMFLEAYRIASRLTMDVDHSDDTVINVVTLKDMNSDARADKNWFTVDYQVSGTTKSYSSNELVKKINHSFVEGNTIVQLVSVIENKFKSLRTDNERVKMTLTDEDLINENLVQKKQVIRPLMATFRVKMEEYASKIKWAWYNMTIGALMLVKKVKASIQRTLRRCKYVLKAKALRCASSMKKIGKELIKRTFSSLNVRKTASYFNQSIGQSDSSGASRLLTSSYRCVGLANVAASVVGYKKLKIGDEKRIDNSIIVLMISAGFETVSSNLNEGVRIAFESLGNMIATVSSIGELAYLILGWQKNLIIGNWKISSAGLSANKIAVSKLNQALNKIRQEMKGIEVVQTGLIIDDVLTDSVDTVTFLNMYELGLSLYEIIRKMWLSVRLSGLFSNLRRGIEYKNDHPFPAQRALEVVPCYEMGSAVSSVVLIGTTGVLALSLALRRVETAVSSIAVITEKKHTYDMVEVYKRDRDLGAVLFRTANLGYGIYLVSTGQGASCVIGVASLCLGVADLVTNSFSELGVCYSLSHILVRMYTARNKVRAAINGWSAWYGGSSTVANGMNALVITGLIAEPGEKDVSRDRMNGVKLEMILAQHKERLANGVLMDKSVKAAKAYDNAKMIVLGRSSVSDLSDEKKWDHEFGASSELLDLNLIANRGLGSADWENTRDVRVTLGDLTENQCRFVGRTKKLLKFDKHMVPDETIERQSSVLALHDGLWRDVVSDADREGWGAAGDSRYAVLLAIAERNDSPIALSVTDELMINMVTRGVELIKRIIPNALRVRSKVRSLDWLTVVSNINERATSGILTRLRTGQQVTAGYLPHYGYRSELLCEMMHDDTMPDECSIINVFAKRRVEKKKKSRLTGVECVITRTIQANEVDLKIACSGSFVMLDKLIKLTKCDNGLAIGLNFFIEFAVDELNTSVECYRSGEVSNVRRISLDHSSFDSSQRNWSITLCRELRMLANELMMLNSRKEVKEANTLIKRIYDGLLIRLMLTTHGDLFAVTGQQMSGHATTSSDNSIKAYLYAVVACDVMKKTFRCDLIKNSMRAQGDDTKFDIIVDSRETSDEEISELISRTMSKLGQAVKKEKIDVRRIGESSSFLSNRCGLVFFIMRRVDISDLAWFESHLVPVRRRKDLIAMLATILKSSSSKQVKKTKKNISLLAAKSMSFLTMYVGDAIVARVCITVIWICFKALTEFKNVSSKMDIMSTHLPWFVEQSGIEGEFEIKLLELMSMHGIARKELGVVPEYWLVDRSDPDYEMMDLPQKLLRNARVVFPRIKDWGDHELLNAIASSAVTNNNRLVKISVAKVNERLNSIKEGLTLSIMEATVPYEPFNRLKGRVKGDRIFISNLGLKKAYIMSELSKEGRKVCDEVIRRIEDPLSVETLDVELTTKDGLSVEGLNITIMRCKEYNIGIVNNEIEARMIEVNPWNVISLIYVKEENVALVHELGKKYGRNQTRGIMITDLNMLNRHSNAKELEEDLNRSLEGVSLERLSKLKLRINDETTVTTRSLLIANDKKWWKP